MEKKPENYSDMEIRLNLIPPQKKEEIRKSKRLATTIKSEVVLFMILTVFFSVLISYRYILSINLMGETILNAEVEKADQFEKIKNYGDQFSRANDSIKQIASIDQAQLYWSRIFVKLSQLISTGIEIDSFSTNDFSVTLAGTADTRDNLITFKDDLEKEKCFSGVDLPLSNLVDKTNVDFQIVFNLDENCLKQNN